MRKTTSMYCHVFHEDFEDFAQTLRLKVCEALYAYDSSRSKMTEEAYVFGCVRNRVKDFLRKLQVRNEAGWMEPALIEDWAPSRDAESNQAHGQSPRDKFEFQYMSVGDEAAFGEIFAEIPLIPSSLTEEEKRIVALLYVGYSQPEVAQQLGISRTAAIEAVKQIRVKFADWSPVELDMDLAAA